MINSIFSKHKLTLILSLFTSLLEAEDIIQKTIDARVRTSYETIPLTDTKSMGTLGTHFDWFPLKSLPVYTGLGFLSSIKGDEGGFFAFGYTLGVNYELYEKIHADAGIYVAGGAGSYIHFPNGGMIVRSHAALSYSINNIDIVLGLARTDFPGTRTNNKYQTDYHPYVGVNIATDIWIESEDTNYSKSSYKNFDGLFENIRITPAMMYYDIDDKIVKKEGYSEYQKNFPSLGIQLDKSIGNDFFISFEAYGALSSAAGYAALQTGLGYDYQLSDYLNWESKVVVGSAGDSRIDTGGGFIIQPMTGFRINLLPSISFKTLVGRTYAPTGLFTATTYEAGISFETSKAVPKKGNYLFKGDEFSNLKWIMTPSIKAYFPHNSTHKSTPKESNKAISLVGITMAVPFNDYVALCGSTHWAMTGNIGSYAEGFFGMELYTPTFTPLDIKAKVSAQIGAGAGAGVNTQSGGYVTYFSAGLDIPLTKHISLNTEIGEMKTSDGNFNAHSLLLGLSIHLNYLYR